MKPEKPLHAPLQSRGTWDKGPGGRTRTHMLVKDKTPQIGFYPVSSQQARCTRAEVGRVREPRRTPLPARPYSVGWKRGVTGSLLTWGRGKRRGGPPSGLHCDSATRACRPLGIPFPSFPLLLAPPRPPPRSDSAGPGPLCVTASLVSASDWTAVFTSLSDKVDCVWVPVSVSMCTCISAHLVSFSACV